MGEALGLHTRSRAGRSRNIWERDAETLLELLMYEGRQ